MRTFLVTVMTIGTNVGAYLTPAQGASSPPKYVGVNVQLPGWPYVNFVYSGTVNRGQFGTQYFIGDQINEQGVVVGTAYRRLRSRACGDGRAWAFYPATGRYEELKKRFRNGSPGSTWAMGISDANRVAVQIMKCSSQERMITQASAGTERGGRDQPRCVNRLGLRRSTLRQRTSSCLVHGHGKYLVSRLYRR